MNKERLRKETLFSIMNSETIKIDAAQLPRPRKANECIIDPKQFYFRSLLFDEFWREGELALLFGAPGTGKSVLAVQIADALARGRNLDGFQMPAGRRKVLYVDLVLQDAQFQARYSHVPPNSWYAKTCKFAENLHWDRPPSIDELVEWLSKTVRENGFRVVIIDDLSAVKRTHDGIRETLALMRQLKRLRDELGVSILAIAGSDEPGWNRTVSEHDLKRSRVLSSVADSVFAIGDGSRDCDTGRCIIQTRSRNSPIFWKAHNAPTAHITRLENGMLGFRFDERFSPRIDEETRRLICRIRSMRETGSTYRAIAEELGVSKTQAARLYKKWTPAMDCGMRNAD
jgi:KaiC/GvpD/RAD55 family RecA-like ATPase